MERRHYLIIALLALGLCTLLLAITEITAPAHLPAGEGGRPGIVQRIGQSVRAAFSWATGGAKGEEERGHGPARKRGTAGVDDDDDANASGRARAQAAGGRIGDATGGLGGDIVLDATAVAALMAATGEIALATGEISSGTDTERLQGTPGLDESLTPAPDESPSPTPQPEGGVEGRVYSKRDGAALPGREVRVSGPGGPTRAELTDNRGRFSFGELLEGSYQVAVVGANRAEQRVQLRPGQWQSLDFAMETGAIVSGMVLDYVRQPLPGARVRLMQAGEAFGRADVLLDETHAGGDGRFYLFNAPVGERVRVEASHACFSPQSVGPFVIYNDASDDLVLELRSAGVVNGFVRDAQGQPIGGAQLEARVFGTWSGQGTGPFDLPQSDADGYYEFCGLPPGTWEIQASAHGFASKREMITLSDDGEVLQLDFELGRGNVIGGMVLFQGQPIPGAHVMLQGGHDVAMQSDGAGAFRFEGVPDGVYVVSARHQSYSHGSTHHISPGDEAVVVNLRAKGRLNIRVTDTAGEPVRSFNVELNPKIAESLRDPQQVRTAQVQDSQGRGSWELVAAHYDVKVTAEGHQPESREINVPEGSSEEEHHFELRRGLVLEGYVLDGGRGGPVAGARLDWFVGRVSSDAGGIIITQPHFEAGTISGSDGRFVLDNLRPELITLVARGQQHAPVCLEIDMNAPPAAPLEVILAPGAVLSGRITHRGQAFIDTKVELEATSDLCIIPPEWRTQSNFQGEFLIPGVPEGNYLLRLTRYYRGSNLFRRYVIDVGGRDLNLDLALPAGEVAALITDASNGGVLTQGNVTLTPLNISQPGGPQLLLPEPTLTLRQTDTNQRFTFVCLPAGIYRLEGRNDQRTLSLPATEIQLGEGQELLLEPVIFPNPN